MQQPLSERYKITRQRTLALANPLSEADMQIQAADFASPGKWHLAHTTWFFEEFILKPLGMKSRFAEPYRFLFNSYYETVGERQPQNKRGFISRPSLNEILNYRNEVDAKLLNAFERGMDDDLLDLVELGIHHEQQHQELFLTDIVFNLFQNPLHPAYLDIANSDPLEKEEGATFMKGFDGGLVSIGHDSPDFCFDNERPSHRYFLEPFKLSNRLITNAEWLEFIEDGGYRNPILWLSDGWKIARNEGWRMPLYWLVDEGYFAYGLYGVQPLDGSAPVSNISFFEADAFARWAGKRLPTEFEWEFSARQNEATDAVEDTDRLIQPLRLASNRNLKQLHGHVWQWTASPYVAYPGFKVNSGSVGEYNGKFMNGQYVLRGSSFATPPFHDRVSYRNFFYPHQRWQFAGLRLAE